MTKSSTVVWAPALHVMRLTNGSCGQSPCCKLKASCWCAGILGLSVVAHCEEGKVSAHRDFETSLPEERFSSARFLYPRVGGRLDGWIQVDEYRYHIVAGHIASRCLLANLHPLPQRSPAPLQKDVAAISTFEPHMCVNMGPSVFDKALLHEEVLHKLNIHVELPFQKILQVF